MNRFCLALVALLLPWFVYAGSPGNNWPDLSQPAPEQGGGEKDSALIIGISDYTNLADIAGAADNAREWKAYLIETRKLDPLNVFIVLDKEAIIETIQDQLDDAIAATKEGGTLWIVFIGHGFGGEDSGKNRTGLLVGSDAVPILANLNNRSLSQDYLFKQINKGKQAQSIVILDACFSGKTPDGKDLLDTGIQVAVLPDDPDTIIKRQAPKKQKKKIVVFTATDAGQYAGPLPGTRKPAFSYLILGAMRGWASNGDGKVTTEEALDYATQILRQVTDRKQTPQLKGNAGASFVLSSGDEQKPSPTFDPLVEKVETGPTEVKPEIVKIKVTSNPKGAQVLVDNQYRGETPTEIPFEKAEGTIKIKVASLGYETSEEFEVSLQQDSEKSFELTALPPIPLDPPFNPKRVITSGALGVGSAGFGIGAMLRANSLCGGSGIEPLQFNAMYVVAGVSSGLGAASWVVAAQEKGDTLLTSMGATGTGLLLGGAQLLAFKCPGNSNNPFKSTLPVGIALTAAAAVDFAVWGVVRNKQKHKDKKTSSVMVYPQGLGATLHLQW